MDFYNDLMRRLSGAKHNQEPTSRIGDVPRLNLRTRYVEIHGQAKTSEDISRFYLKVDNANEKWNKGLVEDVIHHIANENRFDPVSVFQFNLLLVYYWKYC